MDVERLRIHADQLVFQWCLAFSDEAVHTGEVLGHALLDARRCLCVERGGDLVSRFPHAQGAQVLVVLHHVGAEERGQFTSTGPPQQVHLPQAFGSVHEAQRIHGVAFALRVDVRHGHVVEDDLHGGGNVVGREGESVVGPTGLEEVEHVAEEQDQQEAERFEDIFHGAGRGLQSTSVVTGIRSPRGSTGRVH